jgi:hypothetical protein
MSLIAIKNGFPPGRTSTTWILIVLWVIDLEIDDPTMLGDDADNAGF